MAFGHAFRMEPKEILARNLQTLMKASSRFNTFPKITEAGGGSNGTLDRIRRMDGNAGVDKLADLGRVFGLDPWQLLTPGLEAKELHGNLLVTTEAWPFRHIEPARIAALSEKDKGYVERILETAIERCEQPPGKDSAKFITFDLAPSPTNRQARKKSA
jgi:hypothetical protein